ncbi:hypothetical protein L9F63_003133 [Diploptera punctata]|uniref:D-isomer specific 2-hydroxyacid dehydrogenase NAD-binding domain-containing protein n=1 Tax=Diploptera punctata TaxID=6984 RepID=A0AAD7ZKR4_DIPPU|nr:hypothetical protein L9F63_003133 [Diploptera punctata]
MGEYVVANIVNHERNLLQVFDNQRASIWTQESKISDHRTISELNIGILGIGTIGKDIAKLLKTLKANVWGMVRKIPEDKKLPYIDEYSLPHQLPCLLQNCDYIINVLPSTEETAGLLNGDVLKHCATKQSVFINIGRGSIIKEDNLINALNKGWLSAAILDVFETEPLPSSSPLWSMPQVRITPHVSGCSRPQHIAEFFKENLLKFQAGEPLNNVLDFEKGY